MTEEEHLAEAAAFGRRMADETIALVAKGQAEHAQLMAMLTYRPPAPLARRTDLKEALLQLYQTRSPQPDPPPRPRLVLVKS